MVVTAQASGSGLSFEILSKVLQAVGLYRGGAILGLVFNSKTHSPIPFALITLQGITQTGEELIETLVSDAHGFYRGIKLPPGKYSFNVRHQDYLFPSKRSRPKLLGMKDYYLGETFTVSNQTELYFFNIPIDPLKSLEEANKSFKFQLNMLSSVAKRFIRNLTIPLFIYSSVSTYLFPNALNFIILSLYGGLFLQVLYKILRPPNIKGKILNTNNEPIKDTLVLLNELGSSTYGAVTLTDSKGYFKTRIKPAVYKLAATKVGYVGIEGQGMTEYEVDIRKKGQEVDLRLEKISLTESDIFG